MATRTKSGNNSEVVLGRAHLQSFECWVRPPRQVSDHCHGFSTDTLRDVKAGRLLE